MLAQDYSDVLQKMDAETLRGPFAAIESKLAQAKDYVEQWLQYQVGDWVGGWVV